jgi:hypothetical protein
MKWIKDLIIEFQRWNFRRKVQAGAKIDAQNQIKAIEKAEKLSHEKRHKLWVIRVEPGKYVIRTKGDVKAILRRLGMKGRIDIFNENEVIVHITK